ncbi:MAG: AI-2E family transporter, partial [Chloroflexota bacterium]
MELTRRERSILTWLGILLVAFLAIQVAMLVLGALAHVVDVILIFLVAWALAYMLVPLVDLIDRRTPLDRWGAVLVVYLAVALLLAATLALVVPVLASQLVTLVDRAPEYGDRAARVVVDWQAQLDRAGFRIDVAGLYGTLPERVGEITGAIAADALGLVAATGALLFNVTLVLII